LRLTKKQIKAQGLPLSSGLGTPTSPNKPFTNISSSTTNLSAPSELTIHKPLGRKNPYIQKPSTSADRVKIKIGS
jgi:hypothetical protein